ncbi:MAG: chemotaxis protein CheX [Planctomycetes bacterium]|nr:chemotaxis protein CheX [Planctomycetota bacterium]
MDLETKLYQSAARTFEEVCFLLTLREPGPELPAASEREIGVRIGFDGVFHGALEITCPASIAEHLANSMLGGDKPTAQQRQDAFGEISNVITGNLLPSIAGDKLVFDVTAPATLEGQQPLPWGPSARVRLRSDEGPIDLVLYIEDYDLGARS